MKTVRVVATWESEIDIEVEDDYEFVPGEDDKITSIIDNDTVLADITLIDWEVISDSDD